MRVLGLAVSHNGAVALVEDGLIRVAIQLERLERTKRFPIGLLPDTVSTALYRAINYCLHEAGIRIEDVDMVAASTPWAVPRNFSWPHQLIRWVPHHLAHAEYVLHFSDLLPGLVLVVDAHGTQEADRPMLDVAERIDPDAKIFSGDMETVSAYRFDGRDLSLLYRVCGVRDASAGWVTPSIGQVWEVASNIIFGRRDQAGKVMGLAAYGARPLIGRLFGLDGDGRFVSKPELLCDPAIPYRDIAREVQEQTSEALLELLGRLRNVVPGRALYYTGGVALNVVSNERIMRARLFDTVFMNGSCEDNGTAVGAALALWHAATGRRSTGRVTEYLGSDYHSFAIRGDLARFPVTRERLETADLVDAVARGLAAGQVIGWFHGRSEFGPRALGNRSILADPRDARMKDRLNGRVKHRESFRPYGACVRADRAAHHFDLEGSSPVMLREAWAVDPDLPAVTHVDGSCRLQTVAQPDNPRLFQLLTRFEELTGKPVLLNTSLNLAGDPIVESPRDALEAFLRTEIDAMAIGNFMVKRT